MRKRGIVPMSALSKRLMSSTAFKSDRMGATISLKRAVQHLLDADDLREFSKAQTATMYNTQARMLIIANIAAFQI
jgi:hypothetical protein